MNKRGVGAIFCLIASILFSARYIAAAIFMSGVLSWDAGLFQAGLEYVGTPLLYLSILSLIVGVGYLVWEERGNNKE
ncbi:hypothetical protein [Clostridium sp.]|uniref:hypothetical protein n=1 Tax=Clostridium sp. TaxID=1506 RepID=UPI001DF4D4D2|nr:hypothetical protein [Clostridium sp.]MBS5988027.1 hypothetical protein [Clostridium sp.]